MSKYNQTLQSVIDRQRELVGKGNWKITKLSTEWALIEHFVKGKWVEQGCIPTILLTKGEQA